MKGQSFDQLCKSQGYKFDGDSVVDGLRKALSTTNSGPGGIVGGPLMLENLDAVMTEVLLTEQHFKLFNMFPRVPSAQPFFEWNRHTSFGNRRGSVGFAEGGAPKGGLSAFERNGIYNKFLGVRGGVTHQMLVTGQNGGSFEDPTTRENRDRTLELFERIEREIMFGNKDIEDESGVEVHFDGLLELLTDGEASNVIDMEGAPLTFDQLDDASVGLVKDGKQVTLNGYQGIFSTDVVEGLNKQYQDRNIVRHNKDSSQHASYTPGFVLPGYDTQFGHIKFDHTLLFEEVPDSAAVTAADASAPAAPATVTPAVSSEASSKMEADTYYYFVGAFNDSGESLATGSAGQAVVVGEKVTLTIARVAGATGYRVYRSTVDDVTTAKWIARFENTPSADPEFDDLNGWRTVDSNSDLQNGLGILIKPERKDLVVSQMTPLIKMPLPQEGTTFPFLLLLYCVLVLKAPERVKIFKNCGKYTPA